MILGCLGWLMNLGFAGGTAAVVVVVAVTQAHDPGEVWESNAPGAAYAAHAPGEVYEAAV
jgi:hypothetical protein